MVDNVFSSWSVIPINSKNSTFPFGVSSVFNFESGTHDKILTTHVCSRSDTEANWAANDPLLELGEFGLTTDGENKGRFKIGDGANSWSALKYYGENGTSGDYVTMDMIENGKAPLPIKALSQDDGTVLVLDGGDADDLSV